LGKIRRGTHLFVTYKGDHHPYHVHVFKDGKLIVKWDLENDLPMEGRVTRKVLRLLRERQHEGRL
jgi:hypothetical protein